jgi:transcriptional regulator with XRE-family HTH domain
MGGHGSGRRTDPARRRKAEALRARGLSFLEIARRLGMTRQGVAWLLRTSGQLLPAVCCTSCAAALADRTDGRDPGRAYCRACLSARPDVPLPVRLRSLRLVAGLTRRALSEQTGLTRAAIQCIECGRWTDPGWLTVRALVEALGVELVPGRRLRFPPCRGDGPGVVACRECGRTILQGAATIRSNGPAYCLACLARHPEANFAARLKAHRLAAGLTLEALAHQVGMPLQNLSGYEGGRGLPRQGKRIKIALGAGTTLAFCAESHFSGVLDMRRMAPFE